MLLAKVLDKLFNRRNTFEVKSLEGDLNGLSVDDLVEWVSEMKDVVSYSSGMLTIDGDLTVDGVTSKGIANTGGIANIGDIVVSGDITAQGEGKGVITANKIRQLLPEYSQELVLSGTNSFTIENIYNRLEVINNILHIVVNVKVKNETESSLSSYSLANCNISLPEDLAKKIIDVEGKSVYESNPDTIICAEPCMRGGNDLKTFGSIPTQSMFVGIDNRTAENACQLRLLSAGQITLPAGSFFYVTGRIALTLI